MTVTGDEPALALRSKGPTLFLLFAADITKEIQPPDIFSAVGKPGPVPQDPEGNLYLRAPALVGNPRLQVPDRIPGVVLPVRIVVLQLVDLHARGIERELVPGLMIVVGIDADGGFIGFDLVVAAGQACDDLLRFRIVVHATEIEGVVVIQDADFRPFRGGFSLIRVSLDEPGCRFGRFPNVVIEHTVQARRARYADGPDARGIIACDRGRSGENRGRQ